MGDFIRDERTVSPEEYATEELLKEELASVLLTLTDREEKSIKTSLWSRWWTMSNFRRSRANLLVLLEKELDK